MIVLLKSIRRFPFWLSFLAVLAVLYEFGFDHSAATQQKLYVLYELTLAVGAASIVARYFIRGVRPGLKAIPADGIQIAFLLGVLGHTWGWWETEFLGNPRWFYPAVFLVFIREFSAQRIDIKRQYLNPAQLFIASFLALVLIGTLLLLLPNATVSGIALVDALFTATSAVCVTGLIVVDTATHFTTFGQIIIIGLVQIGGIGIMTFTSYFSYFFRGGSSYETQLSLRDMTNVDKMAEVFSTLRKILILMFSIEAIGAVIIYFTVDPDSFSTFGDRLYFAVFHAISGFCNSGFSTATDGLYHTALRFNYGLHLTIAMLFILGGIGFPIAFNFLQYVRHVVVNRLLPFGLRRRSRHVPWVINLNTRIAIITSFILLVAGTLLFFVFEYDNTLTAHSGWGKAVTAFFGAATPRSAGFNTVDTSALKFHTIMMIFFLMWVGGSPMSTAGGIKTSTLAVATLNILSLAQGKDRIEVFRREISFISMRRASAIISLSLIVIGGAVFLISATDPDQDLIHIAFECFSAYSTCGLSLGVTPELSAPGKLVIIGTMFVGRVGMLAVLVALMRKVKHLQYRYPSEDILIN